MRELFSRIDESNDGWETHVTVSFLEIYNELIRDLLADDFPACPRGGLSLREDEKNRITVAGLSQKTPKTADEVLEYVLLGNSRRHTSATHANSQSSRSHAVLQVNIGRRPRGGDTVDLETETVTTAITSATLSIIDLAGSERASATQNMGNRMKEGANINKSLLSLGNCINALCVASTRGNSQPHIPYRDSKLTRLLKFSLGGNCRTVMIVCVSPCSVHLEDTGNTLKYANRAKNIVTKVSRNVNDVNRNITQYLKAIAEKDARIKVLEAEVANGSRTEHAAREKRLAEGRAEMARVKADLRQASTRHAPVIADGALCRALVDGAELRIDALKSRLAELESATEPEFEAEKETLQSLIDREQTLYASNPVNQSRIHDAATKSDLFSAVLRAASERRFDKLESSDIESLRAEAELQRIKSELQSLEAREKAYRGAIAHQARALTRLIGGMVRTMTLLQGHVADEGEEMLDSIINENRETIAEVLGMGAAGEAPPRHISSMFAVTSAMKPVQPTRAPNRRLSTANTSIMQQPLVRPSPAIKRIQLAHALGSPLRGSPRKRSAGVAAVLLKQKKTLRWRDEAGEGSIGSVHFKSDDSRTAGNTDSDETPTPSPVVVKPEPMMDPEENAWVDDSEELADMSMSARTSTISLPAARPIQQSSTGILSRFPPKRPLLGQVVEESSFVMERSPRRPAAGTIGIPKAHAMRPMQRMIAPPSVARAPLQTSSAANVNRQTAAVPTRPAADKPIKASSFLVRTTPPTETGAGDRSVVMGDVSVAGDRSMMTTGLLRPTASSARRSSLSGTAVGPASRRVSAVGTASASGLGPIRRPRISSRGGLGAIGEETSSSSERASHRSMVGLRKPSPAAGDISVVSSAGTSSPPSGRLAKPRSSVAPGMVGVPATSKMRRMSVAGLGGGAGASRPSRMSVSGGGDRSFAALPAPAATTARLHQPTQASANRLAARRVSVLGSIHG
jgi:kinesin family protein 18/19